MLCILEPPAYFPEPWLWQAGAPGQEPTPGAAAQQPVAVPPPDAYHAQPHIPQTFQPTGRKKALICACNYACDPMPTPCVQALHFFSRFKVSRCRSMRPCIEVDACLGI